MLRSIGKTPQPYHPHRHDSPEVIAELATLFAESKLGETNTGIDRFAEDPERAGRVLASDHRRDLPPRPPAVVIKVRASASTGDVVMAAPDTGVGIVGLLSATASKINAPIVPPVACAARSDVDGTMSAEWAVAKSSGMVFHMGSGATGRNKANRAKR